jgi:O-antigen/teichoic acid export membrane protein
LLKKILSYGAVEGIAKGLNKLILLLLPFFLITEEFGKVGLIISLEFILPLITLLGLDRALLRFYSEKSTIFSMKKTVITTITIVHIIVLLLLGLCVLMGINNFFGLSLFPDLFLIVLLVYFQGINRLTLNIFRVDENHKEYFKARFFLQIGKLVLVVLFIWLTKSYIGYIIGSLIVSVLVNILYSSKNNEFEYKSFDKSTFNYLFSFSWPFIFHGIAANVLGNADKFILERFMTMKDVGLYTFAYSIGSMMIFAYVGVSIYLEPMIYKAESEAKRENLLSKYTLYAIGSGLLIYIGIILTSSFILPHFYKQQYSSVFKYIPLIALAHLLYPYYLTSNYRMIHKKKSLRIAITSIIACAFNIGLNILLIPIYGIYAAVLVTLISYSVQTFGFVYVSNNFKLSWDMLEILFLSICFFFVISFDVPFYWVALLMGCFLLYIYYVKLKKK